jgi:D-alanine-D-alanine ligase-like ATP-grasp enzyme
MKIRVAVVYGGRTGEHQVSVRSAQAILAGLDPEKYEKIEYFIDRQGKWSPRPILPEPGMDRWRWWAACRECGKWAAARRSARVSLRQLCPWIRR